MMATSPHVIDEIFRKIYFFLDRENDLERVSLNLNPTEDSIVIRLINDRRDGSCNAAAHRRQSRTKDANSKSAARQDFNGNECQILDDDEPPPPRALAATSSDFPTRPTPSPYYATTKSPQPSIEVPGLLQNEPLPPLRRGASPLTYEDLRLEADVMMGPPPLKRLRVGDQDPDSPSDDAVIILDGSSPSERPVLDRTATPLSSGASKTERLFLRNAVPFLPLPPNIKASLYEDVAFRKIKPKSEQSENAPAAVATARASAIEARTGECSDGSFYTIVDNSLTITTDVLPSPIPILENFLDEDCLRSYQPLEKVVFEGDVARPRGGDRPFPKPNFSYGCLISVAILNSRNGTLPVNEIYRFIEKNFPFYKTASYAWKNAIRHGLIMGNWFKKLDNPNNHKACLWTLHPTSFGAIDRHLHKSLRQHREDIQASMAYPHLINCIIQGIIKPTMIKGLYKFQEALLAYWGRSGRTPQLDWWHSNAPWLPNHNDSTSRHSFYRQEPPKIVPKTLSFPIHAHIPMN